MIRFLKFGIVLKQAAAFKRKYLIFKRVGICLILMMKTKISVSHHKFKYILKSPLQTRSRYGPVTDSLFLASKCLIFNELKYSK